MRARIRAVGHLRVAFKETPLRHWSFVSPVDVTPHRGVQGLRG